MESILINTGLEKFSLIETITRVEPECIEGGICFSNAPVFLSMESLAQLGALHVRYLIGFKKHAFLLKIKRFSPETCSLEAGALEDRQVLNGRYRILGQLTGQSSQAFSYKLLLKKEERLFFTGEFLFGTVEYGDKFKRTSLENHYKRIFACLQNGLKTD